MEVEIEIDVGSLIPDGIALSRRRLVIGQIKYQDGQQGTLIRLKPSCSGEESEYSRFYNRKVTACPREPAYLATVGWTHKCVERAN